MPTLPTPGGDTGTWGDELNEYLNVGHNTNGSLKRETYDLIYNAGLLGDGTTDESMAFANAITAAGGTKIITSPPGMTYLVNSELTLSAAGSEMDLQGSTIKKKNTMAVNTLRVSGANSIIRNVVVNGNRAGGATEGGLYGDAAGVKFINCRVSNTQKNAFFSLTGDSDFIDCVASDVDDGLGLVGSGNGFHATGGIVRTKNCRALNCVRAGFISSVTASAGSVFDGYAYQCGFGVNAPTNGNGCRIVHLVSEDSIKHGAFFNACDDWTIDFLASKDAGLTSADSSCSGLQMNGCTGFNVGTFSTINSTGYALALAGASLNNRFASVFIYSAGDPGIDISGGSSENYIGNAYIRACTYAIVIGEGLAGSNDSNYIGQLYANDCAYGAYRIDIGSFNHVGRIVARDCYTTDATYTGLIDFSVNAQPGAATTENVVGFIDHRATGTKPKYVVHFDANAVKNYVMDGFDRTHYVTADVLDSNTGNFVSPALGAAGSLRA